MYKVIWLLRRKPGVSPQTFREGYERHAVLAQELVGHLLARCVRNYTTEASGGGTPTAHGEEASFGPIPWPYDCIAEIYYHSEDAFLENNRIFADAELGGRFYEDEEDFLDRSSVVLIKCDVIAS